MSRTIAHLPRRRRQSPGVGTSHVAERRPAHESVGGSELRLLRSDEADAVTGTHEIADLRTGETGRAKRLFDIVVATLLLVACVPLMLLIAVVSKLSQPGPLLYRQDRVGLNGRLFPILKFRSMRVDAERETGPVFAIGNDPRCTRFGAWLRRSCCDELPQLINVIRGEMSLVGPRPERPNFVAEFHRTIPRYNERHHVRPGITGWAQINGWRGDTRFAERLQFDLDYVRRASVWFDLTILLRTPGAILWPKQIPLAEAAAEPVTNDSAGAHDADRTDIGGGAPMVIRRAA